MKKAFIYFLSGIVLISCGHSQSSINSHKKIEEPVTFESALKNAYGPSVINEPDTLALGFHWGMNKFEVNSHIKALVQSKKVFYKSNKGYMYPLPLTHYAETGNITEDYVFRLSTETYKDTIKTLNLWLKGQDNNHSGYALTTVYNDLTIDDLYKQFGPIFVGKGYLCKVVDVEQMGKEDNVPGIPNAKWKGDEYRFVKGNTMIRIWRGEEWYSDFEISYYDLSVIYQEQCDIAEKEALAAKKAAAENAIRESKKQEYLSDF